MLDRREPLLQTARLRLRPLVVDDAPAIHEAMADPQVMAHWSSLPHTSIDETASWIRAGVEVAEAGGAWEWAIEHNRAVVGRVGFHEPPWIGYFLSRRSWGKGVAYEAIGAVCRYAFDVLAWPAVHADVAPTNDRSLRMLARLEFAETARASGTWLIDGVWADSVFLALEHPTMPRALRIEDAGGVSDTALVRGLLREYHAWLGVDLGFQQFEEELRSLPGRYVRPGGALLLAFDGGVIVGMAAMRRHGPDTAEMKRLYVRPVARGRGVGQALARAVIDRARAAGYTRVVLDTLPVMSQAHRLYAHLGFREIPPYYSSPLHGTRFLELSL